MNYGIVFWLLSCVTHVKGILAFTIFILVLALIISVIIYGFAMVQLKDESASAEDVAYSHILSNLAKSWIKWVMPFFITCWIVYVIIPTKKELLLINSAGITLNFLQNNKQKQIPDKLSIFLLTEIDGISKNEDVNMNLDELKKQLLLERIKQDTLLHKLLN